MDDEITGLILSGITTKEFAVYYLMGVLGILIRFLADLWWGIRVDRNTPFKFQWRYFMKGFIRIVVSLLILAIVVARFEEYSHHLVSIDFAVPTRLAEGNSVVVGITTGTAIAIGLGIDEVIKKVVGIGDKVTKKR